MTDPSTVVALAPIVNPLADYINTAVGALTGLAVTTVCGFIVRYLHVQVSQSFVDAFTAEAKKQAGIMISRSMTSLAGKSIDTHSSEVAVAANWAATQIPDVLKKAGKTPDDFAHTIVAELGKLTAATPDTKSAGGFTLAPPEGSQTVVQGQNAVIRSPAPTQAP